MFLFDTNYLITLQAFVEYCLCDNKTNNIICNTFSKKSNLFNVFMQIK